jgi:hypothetical protein
MGKQVMSTDNPTVESMKEILLRLESTLDGINELAVVARIKEGPLQLKHKLRQDVIEGGK